MSCIRFFGPALRLVLFGALSLAAVAGSSAGQASAPFLVRAVPVASGRVLQVKLSVTNVSGTRQMFSTMSCSWQQHWTTDNARIHPVGGSCKSNFPMHIPLGPGQVYREQLCPVALDRVPAGRLTLRFGYSTTFLAVPDDVRRKYHFPAPQIFWSNAIRVQVKPSGTVSLIAPLPLAERPDPRWLQKARRPGLTPLRRSVYERLARVRLLQGGFFAHVPRVPDFDGLGLDALPVLTEALADTTPTLAVYTGRSRQGLYPVRVNEVVGGAIVGLAGRNFVIGPSPHERTLDDGGVSDPALVPAFRRMVLDWYAWEGRKPFVDRMIGHLRDGWFRNRLDAVEFLGRGKVRKSVPGIVQYVDRTLAAADRQGDSLLDDEMAEGALALGQIGDRAGLPAVRRVCRHLSADMKRQGVTTSGTLDALFRAYGGRALLGDKAGGLAELQTLYAQCSARMDSSERREYQTRLKAALTGPPRA